MGYDRIMKSPQVPAELIVRLVALHAEIDAATERLTQVHGSRLRCGYGCHACCSDDLSVFEVEAARIAEEYRNLLAHGTPAPRGRCAFLGEDGGCRIYSARPYVCRTQGLPLRWFHEIDAHDVVEHRDICVLNEAGPPIVDLPADACWLLGPFEGRIAQLQEHAGRGGARVALRALFGE